MAKRKKKNNPYESPDGRFKLITNRSSDHFQSKEMDWLILDTNGGERIIATFSDDGPIYKVEFSPDGWSVIATDALGRVVERVDLKKIADES